MFRCLIGILAIFFLLGCAQKEKKIKEKASTEEKATTTVVAAKPTTATTAAVAAQAPTPSATAVASATPTPSAATPAPSLEETLSPWPGVTLRNQWMSFDIKTEGLEPFRQEAIRAVMIVQSRGTGEPVVTASNEESAVGTVEAYHMRSLNYPAPSSHFYIGPSGAIFQGRPVDFSAQGANGALWKGSVVVSLLGNFHKSEQEWTVEAQEALVSLLKHLTTKAGVNPRKVQFIKPLPLEQQPEEEVTLSFTNWLQDSWPESQIALSSK